MAMKLSERRARDRGRREAAEIRLVEVVTEELPHASLPDLVEFGLKIEAVLAPLREQIGPTITAYETTMDEFTKHRVNVAAAEAWPVLEPLLKAQALVLGRIKVLAAEQGLAFDEP